MKKNKIIMISVIGGLVLAIIEPFITRILKISGSTYLISLVIIVLLIMLLMLLFQAIYLRKYKKRVLHQIDLLNNLQAKEALEDMEKLYQEVSNKKLFNLKNIVRLNMTACLADLKEYEEALKILVELKEIKFTGYSELVYRLNYAACLFYLGKEDKALIVYGNSSKIFEKYKESRFYGGHIAVIKVMALLASRDYKEARLLLDETVKKWDNPRLFDDYKILRLAIQKAENKN